MQNNNIVWIWKYLGPLYIISEHKCSFVDPNIILLDHVVLFFSFYLVPAFCSIWCLSANKHSLNGAIRQSSADFMQNMLSLSTGRRFIIYFSTVDIL